MDINVIQTAVSRSGLTVLGGFHGNGLGEDLGEPATVVLVGNAGPAMWAAFSKATTDRARREDGDPLDDWTRRVLEDVAGALAARALFPFEGPPYHPFQQWALRTGAAFVSPTGPLIHPEFGLWHAYRGALVFDERFDLPPLATQESPCGACDDKPCLGACPADVFDMSNATDGRAAYDVPACVTHIASPKGAPCFNEGCLARRACPVGGHYVYERPQANFHMVRFLKAQG